MHITPTTKEIIFARDYLIRKSQKLNYPEKYELLQNVNSISEKSALLKLNPRLENGIIVMQGRIGDLYQMPEQMKHPIILLKDLRIT